MSKNSDKSQKKTTGYGKGEKVKEGDNNKTSHNSPAPYSTKDNNQEKIENLKIKLPKKTTSTKSKNSNKINEEENFKTTKSSDASFPGIPELNDDLKTSEKTSGGLRKSKVGTKKEKPTHKDLEKSSNPVKHEKDTDNNSDKTADANKESFNPVQSLLNKFMGINIGGKNNSNEGENHQADTTDPNSENKLQLVISNKGSPKQPNTRYEEQTYVVINKRSFNPIDNFVGNTVNNTMNNVNQIIASTFSEPFFSSPFQPVETYPQSRSVPTVPTVHAGNTVHSVPTVTEIGSSSTTESEDS